MDNWIIEIRLSDIHGEAEHNTSWEKSKSRLHVNYISTQIPIKLTANQSINNHRDSNGRLNLPSARRDEQRSQSHFASISPHQIKEIKTKSRARLRSRNLFIFKAIPSSAHSNSTSMLFTSVNRHFTREALSDFVVTSSLKAKPVREEYKSFRDLRSVIGSL